MSKWKEYKIGDVISVNANSIGRNYPFSEIEYLDTGSITRGKIDSFQKFFVADSPSRAKRLVNERDIVYSTVRPIQRHYGIIKNPQKNLVVSTGFAVLSCDKTKADADFIYYYLTQDDIVNYFDMVAEGSTSAYPSLTPDVISNLEISLPPLPEQKSIASVLSSLDDKIDLLHRNNKTLEEIAETIFRQHFIQVENNWEEKSLDEIANFLNGLACQKYPPKFNSLPVIKIKELRTGFTDATDLVDTNIPEEYIVNDGDILFSWSGSLEVVIWAFGKGVLNQHLFKITSAKYPKWFFYLWTKFHLPEFRTIASDKATTMGHIQRHHLSDAKVLVPPPNKLTEMDNVFSPLIEKIISNNSELRNFQILRDTLLPKLMSGEVRVKN